MMQKLMEINDHLVRTLAECEQLRSDQKTLQEICSIRLQRINELQTELRKAYAERDEAVEHAGRLQAERDELRKDQTKLQGICAHGGRRITELKAELDATRKQLQNVLFEQEDISSVGSAGQSDLVRDVSHYIEAAEVDTPVESQPEPQPVQVREGRWRKRSGVEVSVSAMPTDHDDFTEAFPWWDGHETTWTQSGHLLSSGECPADLVEYLGPIEEEPQPQPQPVPVPEFKRHTFAAYIVGDKIQPDALRIVWATEEWIEQSKFGIVHRMRDMHLFDNDGGCNITEYHETLTLTLKVQ